MRPRLVHATDVTLEPVDQADTVVEAPATSHRSGHASSASRQCIFRRVSRVSAIPKAVAFASSTSAARRRTHVARSSGDAG